MKPVDLHRRAMLRNAFHAMTLIPVAALVGCGSRARCDDTSGLAPADVKARQDQNYLETTSDPQKACDFCDQWLAAADEKSCGGCKVLKGPINAKGTCNLFVKPA